MKFLMSPHFVPPMMVTSRSKHAGDVIKQIKIITWCVNESSVLYCLQIIRKMEINMLEFQWTVLNHGVSADECPWIKFNFSFVFQFPFFFSTISDPSLRLLVFFRLAYSRSLLFLSIWNATDSLCLFQLSAVVSLQFASSYKSNKSTN